MRMRLAAAALSLVALAACSSNDDGGAIPIPSTTSTSAGGSTSTSAGASSTSTAVTAAGGGSTATVSIPRGNRPAASLTAVRVATRPEGGDRIVFEFRNGVPGYSVGYVAKPVTADGSGAPVALKGSLALQVRMEPASGFDIATASPSYTGPERIAGPGDPVLEMARSGDFEAVLSWVVGLDHKAPFAVQELTAPPRLVVDVSR